jgi:uncharacterized membrane protein
MAPLLSAGGLRGLVWRRLHPPSARRLHAHSPGGYSGGSWRRRTQIYSGGGVRWRRFLAKICLEWLRLRGVKNPKDFGFYL